MMNIKISYSKKHALVLSAALILAACGGGSSSSLEGLPSTEQPAPLPVPQAAPLNVPLQPIAISPHVPTPLPATDSTTTTNLPPTPAPSDAPYKDANKYGNTRADALSMSAVNEGAAVTHHTLQLDGKTVPYTATVGHLTASDPTTKTPEVSFFYAAYTADTPAGTPKRPVTFFFNGGPGSASAFLHLMSFGPKRMEVNAPNIDMAKAEAGTFSFDDNADSLLDQTDLVFVDAVGTGYSEAIAPNTNQTFWGVDTDAAVFRDFVMRYLNVNQRTDAPFYLFGESYGTPRAALLSRLLTEANPSLPPTGIVLHSSILDYNADCTYNFTISCVGFMSNYAATALYYGKIPQVADAAQFLENNAVPYMLTQYLPAWDAYYDVRKNCPPPGRGRSDCPDNFPHEIQQTLLQSYGINEIPEFWYDAYPFTFSATMKLGYKIGRYDSRVNVPSNSHWTTDGDTDPASTLLTPSLEARIPKYLGDELKYTAASMYELQAQNFDKEHKTIIWLWKHNGRDYPDTVPDLQATLDATKGQMKVLSLNGYNDLATPYLQSRLDLARLHRWRNVQFKIYEGGHMIYLTDESRKQERADLQAFYAAKMPL